jgi:hypothetical protein
VAEATIAKPISPTRFIVVIVISVLPSDCACAPRVLAQLPQTAQFIKAAATLGNAPAVRAGARPGI